MEPNTNLEQLAENFKNLSVEDKEKLRALLGEEWFEPVSMNEKKTIQTLLQKSEDQHQLGNVRTFENIISESRKKYGK